MEQHALKQSPRWNVEFHLPVPIFDTKKPLIKCSEYYIERKKFTDTKEIPDSRILYLGLENVSQNTGEVIGEIYRMGSDVKSRAKIFHQGDVLYSRLRPNLNKVIYWDRPETGLCSTEFLVLSPKLDRINGLVLRSLLSSKLVQNQISRLITGAALPRLLIEDFSTLMLPEIPTNMLKQYSGKISDLISERREHAKSIDLIDSELNSFVDDLY